MLKRVLVVATMLFFVGIFSSVGEFNTYPLILALLAVGCGAFFAKRKAAIYFLAAIMIFSGSLTMKIAELKRNDIQGAFSGRCEKLSLTVTGFSENNRAFTVLKDGKRNIKAYLTVENDILLSPGDMIEGDFTFAVPYSSKEESFSFADYLSGKGTFLTVRADKISLTGRKTDGYDGMIYSIRRYMNSIGKKHFSGNGRALFNAMLFGDKSLMSEKLEKSLQASGLSHIAVVSGMHLSVVIAFVMFLIHKIFGKSRLAFLPAFFVAMVLTFVTGAGASVMRAFIMSSVFLLSQTLQRESDSLSSLSFAAFVMALLNPFVIFDAGFILSVLSVLGIILYNQKFSLFFEKFMPEKVAEIISLSLSAQIAVMPALAHFFGIVTPYALLSNLLLVAVSSLFVVSGMVFSFIPQSVFISRILEISSSAVVSVCKAVGKLPGAVIEIKEADMCFILLWVLVLVLIHNYPQGKLKNNKFVLQWLKLYFFYDIM